MLSKTHGTRARSPARSVIANEPAELAGNGSPGATESGYAPVQPSVETAAGIETQSPIQTAAGVETRGARFRRKAHRSRLYGYAIVSVALVAYLIALAASNTARVSVSWVFGSSHVSLVWLVLVAAILGWLLGLATSARFHWRTRAPHVQHGARRAQRGAARRAQPGARS